MFYQAKNVYGPLYCQVSCPLTSTYTVTLTRPAVIIPVGPPEPERSPLFPSNQATLWKYQPKRKSNPRMYRPCQRKLLQSIKMPCLPDVHSNSIIHSPTIKCLVSGRHWGPRDGSGEEQKQTDHAHGATVHNRRCEELFLRHFNIERCSISFSRK